METFRQTPICFQNKEDSLCSHIHAYIDRMHFSDDIKGHNYFVF
jgi:hypothetical protein